MTAKEKPETLEELVGIKNVEELDTEELPVQDELTALKKRAEMLGIKFSNNIGINTLRERIEKALSDEPQESEVVQDEPAQEALTPRQKLSRLRRKIRERDMALVRVRISCMNPDKSELQGEIITVSNSILGTVRKYVPFGEATENGYHIPRIIYNVLKERKFLHIKSIQDKQKKTYRVEKKWIKEFAIEELPPLTPKELKELADDQRARGI